MVDPEGNWLEVERIGHNLGKIHDAREAVFELTYKDGTRSADKAKVLRTERLAIAGAQFRKVGLGKDVTDKFLGGVRSAKEGCDGLITSARWIVHQMPRTFAPFASNFSDSTRGDSVDRRNHRLPRAAPGRRHPGGAGAPGRSLSTCSRLHDQIETRRLAEDGTGRRYRRRRRCGGRTRDVRGGVWPMRSGEGFVAVTPTRARNSG